jgi:RNA polymerase sigma-70 factor (ECF subfamily)
MSDSPSALHTRPSLLVRIRDPHDTESWKTFVSVYSPVVYRFCRSRGLQDADAEDVTQEVLAEVAKSIGAFRYQPQRGRFRDWLWTVTRRMLGRFSKKRAGAVPGLPDEELDRVATGAADAEWTDDFNAQVLRTALDNVRPHFEAHTWRAFELTWLENRPAAQAAAELGMVIDAVYLAKSRVLKRLEQEFRELVDDVPF